MTDLTPMKKTKPAKPRGGRGGSGGKAQRAGGARSVPRVVPPMKPICSAENVGRRISTYFDGDAAWFTGQVPSPLRLFLLRHFKSGCWRRPVCMRVSVCGLCEGGEGGDY